MTDVYADAVQTYSLIECQKKADDWLSYACGYSRGRAQDDPVYKAVTENRDPFPKLVPRYSSCGDLAHWMFARLGVREPWVNRRELANYRIGMNVGRLSYLPAPVLTPPMPIARTQFQCGDVIVIWREEDTSDAHVICVIEHDTDRRIILTAEYGQPGGRMHNHPYVVENGLIRIGRRFVHRWLPLEAVLKQACAHGRLLAPEEPPQLSSQLT